MCFSMYVRKLSQFLCCMISVRVVDLLITCVFTVAITGELSDDSSKLDSTCMQLDVMPWITKKSNKSGNLFGSDDQ
jgi:hypothetical protein